VGLAKPLGPTRTPVPAYNNTTGRLGGRSC